MEKGFLCENCLKGNNNCGASPLQGFKAFCELWKELELFSNFSFNEYGIRLSDLQLHWLKRFLLGESFSLLSPTGSGKTTFGILLSSWLAKKNKKSYLLFPTSSLVKQVSEKLRIREGVVSYTSELSKKEKEEAKEKINNGDFKILLTTSSFLDKNFSILKNNYSLIFVDDVDSILKASRRINKLLSLLSPKTQLLVSTATVKPNPSQQKALRALYKRGFQISRVSLNFRNVIDYFLISENPQKTALEIAERFGEGGLFLFEKKRENSNERIESFIKELEKKGLRAGTHKDIEEFEKGKVDVLVGISHPFNPLVRGIDSKRIKYVVFVGVPKIEIELSPKPSILKFAFKFILHNSTKLSLSLSQRKKIIEILEILSSKKELDESTLYNYFNFAKEILSSKRLEEVVVRENLKIIVGDSTTYLQGSGRSSRLTIAGFLKGISILISKDENEVSLLHKRLRALNKEISFREFDFNEALSLLKKIKEERKLLEKIKIGNSPSLIKTSLLVVESPTKAKTIASFFGRPIVRKVGSSIVYETAFENRVLLITSTLGHVFDLDEKEGKWGVIINEKSPRVLPVFRFIEGKEETLSSLRKLAVEVDEVLIATDPDREGEKIAYDVFLNLLPLNSNIYRVEFHEITRKEFLRAIKNKRGINLSLVKSQLFRRICDRWIGFIASQYLTEKFGVKNISAGRVQTPVLTWIVEREKERRKKCLLFEFNIENYSISFRKCEENLVNKLKGFDKNKQIISKVLLKKKEEFSKDLILTPFTTSELIREASSLFGFTPTQVMNLAQQLFEMGFITYHRTDSTHVSEEGKKLAKEIIEEHYSKELFFPRSFGKEGAHECIRPTKPITKEELTTLLIGKVENLKELVDLYDLIFLRFISSQMKALRLKLAKFLVKAKINNIEVSEEVEVLKEKQGFLPYPLRIHVFSLEEGSYKARLNIRRVPLSPPYSFSEVIEEMKRKGIGSPSTYAITIEKLLKRKYVIKKSVFLLPTSFGKKAKQALEDSPFWKFLEENFTKELEDKMDEIERSTLDYEKETLSLFNLIFKE